MTVSNITSHLCAANTLRECAELPYHSCITQSRTLLFLNDTKRYEKILDKTLDPTFYIVYCFDDLQQATKTVGLYNPSLIFVNLQTPYNTDKPYSSISALRKSGYNSKICVISDDHSLEQVRNAIKCGANGYLVAGTTDWFWNNLNNFICELFNENNNNNDLTPAAIAYLKSRRFTENDIAILLEFTKEYGREKEIARILDQSEQAVRKKFQSIRERLEVSTQADLAKMIGVLSCF